MTDSSRTQPATVDGTAARRRPGPSAPRPAAVARHPLAPARRPRARSRVVLVVLAWALVPGLFTAGGPDRRRRRPTGCSAPSAAHWFGTDQPRPRPVRPRRARHRRSRCRPPLLARAARPRRRCPGRAGRRVRRRRRSTTCSCGSSTCCWRSPACCSRSRSSPCSASARSRSRSPSASPRSRRSPASCAPRCCGCARPTYVEAARAGRRALVGGARAARAAELGRPGRSCSPPLRVRRDLLAVSVAQLPRLRRRAARRPSGARSSPRVATTCAVAWWLTTLPGLVDRRARAGRQPARSRRSRGRAHR